MSPSEIDYIVIHTSFAAEVIQLVFPASRGKTAVGYAPDPFPKQSGHARLVSTCVCTSMRVCCMHIYSVCVVYAGCVRGHFGIFKLHTFLKALMSLIHLLCLLFMFITETRHYNQNI